MTEPLMACTVLFSITDVSHLVVGPGVVDGPAYRCCQVLVVEGRRLSHTAQGCPVRFHAELRRPWPYHRDMDECSKQIDAYGVRCEHLS